MFYVAIDAETELDYDRPEHGTTPPPVCWSVYPVSHKEGPALLAAQDDRIALERGLNAVLKHDGVTLIGQNFGFDLLIAWQHHDISLELIFDKLNKGLIKDTAIRERLLNIAAYHPSHGERKVGLDTLVKKYLDIDISGDKKGEDIWRLRYAELQGLPIKQYPPEAARYAKADAKYTYDVFNCQNQGANVSPDEDFQMRSDIALKLMAKQSFVADQKQTAQFKARHKKIVDAVEPELVEAGILRWNKSKNAKEYPDKDDPRRGGYSVNTKVVQELIVADCDAQGIKPSRTKTGKISMDKDALRAVDDPTLKSYASVQNSRKLINAFVPSLEKAGEHRLRMRYDVLKKTGRVSCVKWDTPIPTRDRGIQNICDIRIGDYVWTHKERWRKVTNTLVRPADAMWKYSLSDGQSITCTNEHRVYTEGNRWRFINECINKLDHEPGESGERSETLFTARAPTQCKADREGVEYVSAQRMGSRPESLYAGAKRCHGISAYQQGETRRKKPYVWKKCGAASQLARRYYRTFARLFEGDYRVRQTFATASANYGQSPRTEKCAGEFSGAPYRQGQNEQRNRQPSAMYEIGTRQDSCEREAVRVKNSSFAGYHKVYDITVEQDESYYACGIFSHNCSAPNVQQMPRAGGARECLKGPRQAVDDRYCLAAIDYDSFEMAALAQYNYEQFHISTMRDAINAGKDLHCITAAGLMGYDLAEFERLLELEDKTVSDMRQGAKAYNFGCAGGLGPATFIKTLSDVDRQTMRDMYPGDKLGEIVRRQMNQWKELWDMQSFFNQANKRTFGGRHFDYVHPYTGRKRKSLSYCDGMNITFQGRCADAAKLAMWRLTESCYRPSGALHHYGVTINAFIHDEFIFEGPKDSIKNWTDEAISVMVDSAQEVIPDVTIRAGAQVMPDRWAKKGLKIEDFIGD